MSAKYYAKRILYGIGKAFYLLGKGIYLILKALAKGIGIAYHNHQERQRREEEERRYYKEIEREAYVAERGRQHAIGDYQEEERARREQDRYLRNVSRNFERELTDAPKVNEDFWTQDFYPKKRKKRR